MNNLTKHIYKYRQIYEFCSVVLIFSAITTLLTNGVLFRINTTLYTGGIGDATSGFLWLAHADRGWGFLDGVTRLINYPVGEQLWSPMYTTWLLVMGPLWLLSRVFSPVASLNIMMLIGFVSAGVAAYYLLRRITHDRMLSFIGAYAIAFVPYHLFKTPEHLTNIYVWIFIAIFGILVAYWRKPTRRRALLLAGIIGAACYTDGYFVFITGVLMLATLIGLLLVDAFSRRSGREVLAKIGGLGVVFLGVVLLVVPIIATQLYAGDKIAGDLSNARDDIKKEVNYYSTEPIDFLLPPAENLIFKDFEWYQTLNNIKNQRSNSGENTNYIGYVILTLFAIGLAILLLRVYKLISSCKGNSWKRGRNYPELRVHVWVVATLATPFILVWMLPPVIHVGSLAISTPIDYLTNYLALWRVPARVFLAMHILLVIAAIITLGVLVNKCAPRMRYFIYATIFALIIVEYFTAFKRPSFGLENMPKGYSWIAKNDDIQHIAELPLVDWPIEISGYYMFGQLIHDKPMVNSGLSRHKPGLFNPLADHTNSETIDYLRMRGVDAVVLHVQQCEQHEWGVLVYQEFGAHVPEYIDKKASAFCVYKLLPSQETDGLFVKADEGFNKSNYLSETGHYWLALAGPQARISGVDAFGEGVKKHNDALLEFNIDVIGDFKKKPLKWAIYQNGVVKYAGDTVQGTKVEAIVKADSPVDITVSSLEGVPVVMNEVGVSNVNFDYLNQD